MKESYGEGIATHTGPRVQSKDDAARQHQRLCDGRPARRIERGEKLIPLTSMSATPLRVPSGCSVTPLHHQIGDRQAHLKRPQLELLCASRLAKLICRDEEIR